MPLGHKALPKLIKEQNSILKQLKNELELDIKLENEITNIKKDNTNLLLKHQ